MRTIVVGDVHGCLEELEELVELVRYKKGIDRLILAGDLVDRGPDSPGVLRWARENGAEAVLGNHDEKHLRYHKHELRKLDNPSYRNPMKPFSPERLAEHLAYTPDDWAYLGGLPHWLRVCDKLVVVHAGVMPGAVMELQIPNNLLRLRYVLKTGDKLRMAQANHVRDQPENCHTWTDLWSGPDDVIYGHQVVPNFGQGGAFMMSHNYTHNVRTYGIDGGCCFGGQLTAAVVTVPGDVENFPYDILMQSVPAKREYRPLAPWTDDPT